MEIGASEAEPIWMEFLRGLTRRGLRGVKLVFSDAQEGIRAAVSRVLCAARPGCRVHFRRKALGHAGKSGRRVVSAFIATAFARNRPKVAKPATLMDGAGHDVLACMSFPRKHRAKLTSTTPPAT